MNHHLILGTAFYTHEPEPFVAALRRAGCSATQADEVRRSGQRDVTFALHYAPERAPMFVDISDLTDERDVNTSEWETAEEIVSDPAVLQSLRCSIDVRHYRNANPAAVQAVLDFLYAEN